LTFNTITTNGKNCLRFDFFLNNLKILIEFDGEQHFKPIKGWGGDKALKKLMANDHRKLVWVQENGYNLIRIKFSNEDNIEALLSTYITIK